MTTFFAIKQRSSVGQYPDEIQKKLETLSELKSSNPDYVAPSVEDKLKELSKLKASNEDYSNNTVDEKIQEINELKSN